MYINAIHVHYVVLPLIKPFHAAGTTVVEQSAIHSIIVRMVSGSHEGWGESAPGYAPLYSPQTAACAFFLIKEFFAPRLVGQDIETADQLLDSLKPFKGNTLAKAALESAWWMLNAQILEKPLHQIIGGQMMKVDGGANVGVQENYDILLQKINNAVDQGYKRVKLKVRPGWDLDMLRIVRKEYPKVTFHIDCNSSYSLEDLQFFKEVDKLGFAMIEQPLFHNDLFDHAELQRQISTPICLDESVKSIRDFKLALRLGSCKVLNIKYGRVGGISVAIKLHNIALSAGIPCWVGGMLESGIGAGINIELATLPNFSSYPGDLVESRRFYHLDITNPEIIMNDDCTFTPSSVPGTPYMPVIERLEEKIREKATIVA